MLALFGVIKMELLEGDWPRLKVRPQRKLSSAPQIVSVSVGSRAFRLKVRPLERDGEATWIEVLDAYGRQALLLESLAEIQERRTAPRTRTSLPVRSPDLPHFHGTALDISDHGMRLAVSAPVAVGMRLRLEIDARNPAHRPRDLSAVTIWTHLRREGGYQIGVRLLSPEESARHAL